MSMPKNKLVFIAIMVLAVAGASTFIFLDESISRSDGVETENIEIVNEEPVSKVEVETTTAIIQNTVSPENSIPYMGGIHGENSEPTPGIIQAELSNLPLLNDVITITATTSNVFGNSTEEVVRFQLTDGWEFVNVSQEKITVAFYPDGKQYSYVDEPLTVDYGQSETFSHQIKPTTLGENYFFVGIPFVESVQFSLFVGEIETIPTDQYWEENPEEAPWNNEPEPEPCVYEDCEPEPKLPDENTSTPDADITEYTTDEHFNETRQKEGLPPINETSSDGIDSEPDSTISVYGYIVNSPVSPFSESTNTRGSDIDVCAWDRDATENRWQRLGCDYSNRNGYYEILNIDNTDEDGTNLDLVITFSTNSQHSEIKDSSSSYYQDQTSLDNDIPNGNYYKYYSPDSSGTLAETKYHRAFWITDAIADGIKVFADNKVYVNKTQVSWQHDSGSSIFSGRSDDGAGYSRGSDTIFLDGYDPSNSRPDDSAQRWTILHEWGHHQMNYVFGEWPEACSGNHQPHNDNTEGCAWKEGWSDFVPFLVDTTTEYEINSRETLNIEEDFFIFNNITYFYDDIINGNSVGHKVEGHVAGALWDIKDGLGSASYDQRNDTNKDNQSLGINEIISVFGKEPLTMNEFYIQWITDYPNTNNIDDIMYLHYMDFTRPSTIGTTIFSDDFEGTLSNWTLTGDDEDWEIRSGISTGTTGNVASSDDCDKNCYMVSDTIDASQATTLTFDRYVSTRIDSNEGLRVEVSTNNGRTWSELVFYSTTPRTDDSTWHTETFDVTSYQSSAFKLKFTGVSSSRSEIVQIDDVIITSSSGGTVIPPTTTSSLFEDNFNGLSNWTKSGDDRWRIVSSWSEGMPPNGDSNNKIVVASNCDNPCILTSKTIDLSSHSSATLELLRFVDRSLDGGEYLSIEVFNGRVWTEIAKWGEHNNEDTDDWEFESFNITRYLDDNFKIRITSLQSSSSEDTGLDYIRIIT